MKLCTAIILICLTSLLTSCITETTGSRREANPEKLLQDLLSLGAGYIRQGDYARAKDKLTRALAIEPRSAQVHNTLGRLFELEGENQLAENHFKKAVFFEPDFSPARNTYGAFLYAMGRYKEAVQQLQFATDDSLYPHRATAFENLGISYLRLNQLEDAAAAFNRSIQLNPRQSRSLLELSEIHINKQDFVVAKQFYRRYERLSRPSSRSRRLCIRLARALNESAKAASCSFGSLAREPAAEESAFVVQVGAFSERRAAQEEQARLRDSGFSAHVKTIEVQGVAWFKVRVSGYEQRSAAAQARQRLLLLGYKGAFIDATR